MRSSVIYGDVFTRHDMEAHPESGSRLRVALSGVPENVRWRAPVRATESDLERVHRPEYIRWVRELARGTCFLDTNTYVTCHSFEAALYAAGSTFAAVERALDGEHLFALVRPPGHHAEPDRAMGFCIFNNAAVAAAKALESVDRVAILDWDLHHGNGTQTAFYGSDRVLYCSVHQENSFPKTGWLDEIGTSAGRGYTLNAPLAPGCTIADYQYVFDEVFIPALTRFRPDALIISAGQDALSDDEHGGMNLEPEDYGVLAGMLIDGTDLPLALTLEGGYGPSLGKAIGEIFSALSGKRVVPVERPLHRSTERVVEILKKVRFC
ncbi:MAG: Histone deacetylase superfamily [Methanoculleus marisnigri]|jgi:Deacetylases, including yeast histone deacetylase and acetoin utilization protein|uniref:Histone deacetylase superfamily n=1 Tax=Methanoculleus marisnigri TaxID=2198 RepID=A0A101IZM4_9EURY|nr:histone deacetylase [Methanoculleus marisnigri]KUK61200.1 MAG: Histone deacetylase superfamily [Methanoculleus marisnigri]KUL04250.1 MAG: Histone deacetylase superfamily [Methanoculleus marisnigri]